MVIGVPGLINTVIKNLSVVVLTGIAGQLGRKAAIGYAMGARLEYILQPVAFGFGTPIVASAPIVAHRRIAVPVRSPGPVRPLL